MLEFTTSRRGTPPRRRFDVAARWMLAAAGLALVFVLAFVAGSVMRGYSREPAARLAAPVAVTLDTRIAALQQRLMADPTDSRAALELAAAYLEQVRETGDTAWYPKAEGLIAGVLEREPENAEAMAWMGALALARHEFAEGLAWGTRALAHDPDLLAAYPVIIDAYVELGRYDEAVAASDTFIQLRPGLPSYTRVAYLRELHGDRNGAIEAMILALDTVPAATEAGAWTRVQLGNLYLSGGDVDAAEREYRRTLAGYPDYAPALAGLARVAAARGDLTAAIDLLQPVVARLPLPEYAILLGDLYTATGQDEAAAEQYALVGVQLRLQQANGVVTDLELALFQADHPAESTTPEQVVAQARAALEERPSIYAHDALAWALYRAGEYDEAWREIRLALRIGTRDALLHYHAGMIAAARGDTTAAVTHLETALSINPAFSVLHAPIARETLDQLDGTRE